MKKALKVVVVSIIALGLVFTAVKNDFVGVAKDPGNGAMPKDPGNGGAPRDPGNGG